MISPFELENKKMLEIKSIKKVTEPTNKPSKIWAQIPALNLCSIGYTN